MKLIHKASILIIVVILFIIMAGCTTDYTESAKGSSPAKSTGQGPYNELKEEVSLEDFKETKEYRDFKERSDGWYMYLGKLSDLEKKYMADITDLIEKFNNEAESVDKKIAYTELIVEKYENWHDELSYIYVPECAKDSYNYYLSSLTKSILGYKAYTNRNFGDIDKYHRESNDEYTKSIKEAERINKAFEKELADLMSDYTGTE